MTDWTDAEDKLAHELNFIGFEMTQDEIIRMAREACFFEFNVEGWINEFERFAALVAAHEREKWEQALPIAMDAMMLQEREACAKVCESMYNSPTFSDEYIECADAIRARSDK